MILTSFFKNLFLPSRPAAGLELGSSAVRLFWFKTGGEALTAATRIAPTSNQGSGTTDLEAYRVSLHALALQVGVYKKAIPVVLILPTRETYLQSFELPRLDGREERDAVNLNMRSLSPYKEDETYMSAQKITVDAESSQSRYVAAFAKKESVDGYVAVAREAGFLPIAVEFSALALARTLGRFVPDSASNSSRLVVRLSSEGIECIVMSGDTVVFDEYTAWSVIEAESGKREMNIADLNGFLKREIQRVMSFTMSKWHQTFTKVFLVGEEFAEPISVFLKDYFGLEVKAVSISFDGKVLPAIWFVALGAAERGRSARAEDIAINLSSRSVREEYEREERGVFASVWRKVYSALFVFFAIAFVVVDSLFAQKVVRTELENISVADPASENEMVFYEKEATDWNAFLTKTLEAKKSSVVRSAVLAKIYSLAGTGLTLKRVAIKGNDVSLSGSAGDEVSALAFKSRLIKESCFQKVSFPPATFKVEETGAVTFSASLMVCDSFTSIVQ